MKYNFSNELQELIELQSNCNIVSCGFSDEMSCDYIEIKINVLNYPQFPVFNVEKEETVKIYIRDKELPNVYCRDDFPITPHLNVLKNGKKTLCLYDVSYNEIKHFVNPSEFLSRINSWLTLTARGELHQPGQPIEPYIEGSNNILLLRSIGSIFTKITTDKDDSGNVLNIQPFDYSKGELCLHCCNSIDLNNKPYENNIINKLPCSFDELCMLISYDLKQELVNFIFECWKIRQTEYFKLVFQQSINKLKQCKVLISILYNSSDGKKIIGAKSFLLNCSFWNLITLLGYRVTDNKLERNERTENLDSIKLETYEPHFYLDKSFAKVYNSEKEEQYKIMQIGLGALGSKLADNMLRSGFGKWIYLDDDIVLPHNIAKHCLNNDYVTKNKAIAMKEYADSIRTDEPIIDVLPCSFYDKSKENQICDTVASVDLVIDTSASVGVERSLCIDVSKETRCVSAFFNPSATSLIVLSENKSRSIRLDDLEMQYYKLLYSNDKYAEHLKSNKLVNYSSSCRNQSFSYSNDNATALAAILSKTIKKIMETENGMISISSISENGINIESVEPEVFVSVSKNNWEIRFSKTILDEIVEKRKASLPKETGGVIIGSFDFNRKICYVVDLIPAPDDSISTPMSFIRGYKGLETELDRYEEVTVGNLYYLGEWHSHTNNYTSQSRDDIILFDKIKEWNNRNSKPGLMIIAGEDHISIYISDNDVCDDIVINY